MDGPGLAHDASVTREIAASVEALTNGMRQVASAAGQVAGSAQSLSQGPTQQAASLEETSASMEEMASMTRRNAENSQEAASSMAETEHLVSDVNTSLGEMVTSRGDPSRALVRSVSSKYGVVEKVSKAYVRASRRHGGR